MKLFEDGGYMYMIKFPRTCNNSSRCVLNRLQSYLEIRCCGRPYGPVRTTRNFVWFARKSVNAKPFLLRTIFCTHQNFHKRYETSKIPSTSFGGCKNFVRREILLFLDIHPSLGHQILQHMDYEANVTHRMTSRHFRTEASVNRRMTL